jgi:hypothetical protein
MTTIPLLDPASVTGRARAIMDGIAARRGGPAGRPDSGGPPRPPAAGCRT